MKLTKAALKIFEKSNQIPSEFWLKLYKQEMENNWLSSNSVKYYLEILLMFFKRNPKITSPKDFWMIMTIKPAYYSLLEEDLAKETLIHFWKSLKKYSDFLAYNWIIEKNIFNDIQKPKKDKPLPKSLKEEEEAIAEVYWYIYYYNNTRIHTTIKMPPVKFRKIEQKKIKTNENYLKNRNKNLKKVEEKIKNIWKIF